MASLMKKKKKKSKVDEVASEIVEMIVAGNSNKKAKKTEKSKAKSKAKSKVKSKSVKKDKSKFTAKDVKTAWKQLEFPGIITTKEVVIMVEEMTGYKLGTDTTAGAKNLRRYLRTLDRYDDDVITHYRWSIKDTEDLDELAEIMAHYSIKAKIG